MVYLTTHIHTQSYKERLQILYLTTHIHTVIQREAADTVSYNIYTHTLSYKERLQILGPALLHLQALRTAQR